MVRAQSRCLILDNTSNDEISTKLITDREKLTFTEEQSNTENKHNACK